jgi:hypothetical protein
LIKKDKIEKKNEGKKKKRGLNKKTKRENLHCSY